ncbi:MchS3 family protein [Collimonas silvisoli]|uniref:MchS3 family protein n=1 Tax=Collimonas silvisoli TaxID=2825884 RepID=UPI001B8B85F1|nr:MchS3 family protein [Collimonas silvisoli]
MEPYEAIHYKKTKDIYFLKNKNININSLRVKLMQIIFQSPCQVATAHLSLKKIISFFLFSALSILPSFFCTGQAAEQTVTDVSTSDDTTLAKTEMFALGNIGFVGHISTGESAYKKILSSDNAEARFWRIYDKGDSTTAAKLYSACAFKQLNSAKFKEVKKQMKASDGKVTTMKADIMRKEDVSKIIESIDQFGC